ncbi:MAG: helix-turn-helix domain-containing protein [Clostridium sp.]|uniref:helix-turn-helix domain-containing protein n=1 Tax=Clostridium sp. TaxID=1506 RepID=UPI003999D36B
MNTYGIPVDEVLKRAEIPLDIFTKDNPSITNNKYVRFMEAIDEIIPNKELPIKLAIAENIETITPPIFAAYCSKNARECIKRISQYKSLAGAIKFLINDEANEMQVSICGEEGIELPEIIIGIEMVLLLNLIRKATKKHIIPKKVIVKRPFTNLEYERFFEVKARVGNSNTIVFSNQDLEINFITRNESMWNFFEPELKKRLSEMEKEESFGAKVRSILVELLPSGKFAIEDVCHKLGISKRTLQRKLKDEDTTFQKQLNHTRELLAKNYLNNTHLSSEDIAYLLGYQDLNSFFRAFSLWTGKTVTEYKNEILK